MSKNDKHLEALEKAMKILQINDEDGLPVEAKWFNSLPIYDEKDLPTDFVAYDYSQRIKYTFPKVEPKELDQFATNFSQ